VNLDLGGWLGPFAIVGFLGEDSFNKTIQIALRFENCCGNQIKGSQPGLLVHPLAAGIGVKVSKNLSV